ncbi:hypothetical protein [uncultured Sphaerotilus sp.]|uniref:hypothetical protein n=1 Tax=uncultured Sphaerotilus sp. TaxID=474984 RepID=UPI0030CA273D
MTLAVLLIASSPHAAQAQGALVGILEGKATLVRQTTRFEIAEGVALKNEDILETAPSSFLQIETPEGHRIGLGASSRLLLAPTLSRRAAAAPRVYLLQGWAKFTPAVATAPRPAGFTGLTPSFEVEVGSGAVILSSDPKEFAAFVESGALKLTARSSTTSGTSRPPLALSAGEFVVERSGEKAVVSGRPAPGFLDQMPRPFRDPLPARAERFRGQQIAMKALGELGYEDIAPWLGAEPGLRTPLLPRWRPRLQDKAFRNAVIARMAVHPEWDPLVFPEKAAQKKAEALARARAHRPAAPPIPAPD